MNKLARLVDRSLNTSVTPLAYLAVAQSFVMGTAFAIWGGDAGVTGTILYPYGMFLEVSVWGWLMTLGAVTTVLGLLLKNIYSTATGAFLLFSTWTFAALTYVENEAYFPGALALVNILMAGYLFLSANIGRLWDYTPSR